MALNNANNPISEAVGIGTQSATITLPALYLSRRAAIKSISLQNGAALSGGTNYIQAKLSIVGGADLASIDSSVTPLVSDVAAPLASLVAPQAGSQGGFPPSTGYPIDIPAGSSLSATVTVFGTGSLTNAKLIVEYYPM